jgi:hypothetical protein
VEVSVHFRKNGPFDFEPTANEPGEVPAGIGLLFARPFRLQDACLTYKWLMEAKFLIMEEVWGFGGLLIDGVNTGDVEAGSESPNNHSRLI